MMVSVISCHFSIVATKLLGASWGLSKILRVGPIERLTLREMVILYNNEYVVSSR